MSQSPDNVIPLPQRPRTCFTCEHYVENYCRLFDAQIDSELYAARDCNGYEEDPYA